MPCKVIKGTDDYSSMRKLYPNILKPLFNKCRVIIKTKNLTFSFEYCNKSKICQFIASFHILKESYPEHQHSEISKGFLSCGKNNNNSYCHCL